MVDDSSPLRSVPVSEIYVQCITDSYSSSEPFWIFAGLNLVYNIKKRYNFSVIMLVKVAPRFGVMLTAMFLSVAFAIMDMTATVHPFGSVGLRGVGPFWKVRRGCTLLLTDADSWHSSPAPSAA